MSYILIFIHTHAFNITGFFSFFLRWPLYSNWTGSLNMILSATSLCSSQKKKLFFSADICFVGVSLLLLTNECSCYSSNWQTVLCCCSFEGVVHKNKQKKTTSNNIITIKPFRQIPMQKYRIYENRIRLAKASSPVDIFQTATCLDFVGKKKTLFIH